MSIDFDWQFRNPPSAKKTVMYSIPELHIFNSRITHLKKFIDF